MKLSQIYCSVLAIAFTTSSIQGDRNFTIDITEFKFDLKRPEYFQKLNYWVLGKKFLSSEFILARNISSFSARINVSMLTKNNKRQSLLNMEADGCKLLQSSYKNRLIQIVAKEAFRKGNIPKRCPLMANKKFYVRNFSVNPEFYPPLTPLMSFVITSDLYTANVHVGTLITQGEIRKI